jgi:hypothetical protein
MILDTNLLWALLAGLVCSAIWEATDGAFALRSFLGHALVFTILALIALAGPVRLG